VLCANGVVSRDVRHDLARIALLVHFVLCDCVELVGFGVCAVPARLEEPIQCAGA